MFSFLCVHVKIQIRAKERKIYKNMYERRKHNFSTCEILFPLANRISNMVT